MISATEALQRLKQGNGRFVEGTAVRESERENERRRELLENQAPFAIILGCADSRVPAELVFDQGLGDLFVIRVAGNIVARSQIGSIEFAAEQFGTRLVVVMGHSCCGAVQATINELKQPTEQRSRNLEFIVAKIAPAVEALGKSGDDWGMDEAVRANIRSSVQQLENGSEILERLLASGDLVIVGAEYSLETGRVEFLDDS